MRTLLISYFLIVIAYLVGIMISTIIYIGLLPFPGNTVTLDFDAATYFMKGIGFLFPILITLALLYKNLSKINIIKGFVLYIFASFLYTFSEISVYTAKSPLSDIIFWMYFILYGVLSYTILVALAYILNKMDDIDIMYAGLAFLLISFIYSLTVKRYFAQNKVISEIILQKEKSFKGKVIGEDKSFIYLNSDGNLVIIPHKSVQMIIIDSNKKTKK